MLDDLRDIPLTLLEAMALGKPVIVSALGPLYELLPSPGGLLVPPGDVHALLRAMVELARDSSARLQMGEVGRNIVLQRFTAARMVGAYEELYSSLI